MVSYLQENEEEFAELLARKTSQDYEREKRFRQQKLAELNARYSEVDMLLSAPTRTMYAVNSPMNAS